MNFLFFICNPEEMTVEHGVGIFFKEGNEYCFIQHDFSGGISDRSRDIVVSHYIKHKKSLSMKPLLSILFFNSSVRLSGGFDFESNRFAFYNVPRHFCVSFDLDYFTNIFFLIKNLFYGQRDLSSFFTYWFLYYFIATKEINPRFPFILDSSWLNAVEKSVIRTINPRKFAESLLILPPF